MCRPADDRLIAGRPLFSMNLTDRVGRIILACNLLLRTQSTFILQET
jgi:hypothetical protein